MKYVECGSLCTSQKVSLRSIPCKEAYYIAKLFVIQACQSVKDVSNDQMLADNVATFVVQHLTTDNLKRYERGRAERKILLKDIEGCILAGNHHRSSQANLTETAQANFSNNMNVEDSHV
ncbi:hypothetical protein GEMRC1_000880 [Eukaryota sp. GEM-RC1]